MSKVILSISMSLDGYIAGENITKETPMGEDGMRLHDWLFAGKTDTDAKISNDIFASTGAVIVGWGTYSIAIHDAWGGETPFTSPAFVLCKQMPEQKDIVPGFTFVTDGIESALAQAKQAAGDKNVWVMGGANIAQQYLKAGLLDELHLNIAPVIFTKGRRLFENIGSEHISLETIQNIHTPAADHIFYRVVK
jgi:dihydrofolate reductase